MNQGSLQQTLPPNILTQNWLRLGFIITAMLSLGQWLLLGVYGWRLPPEIPLYHSAPVGAAQLSEKIGFLAIPLLSLLFFLVSLPLIKISKKLPSVFVYTIVWGTTLNIFLLTIVMTHVIYLVF